MVNLQYLKIFIQKIYKKYITNELSLRTTHILRSKVNCILSTSKTINMTTQNLIVELMVKKLFTTSCYSG